MTRTNAEGEEENEMDYRSDSTTMSLAVRNLAFTVVIPGAGGVYVPWLILTRNGTLPHPVAWYATVVIAAGVLLYAACQWKFAFVGRGTPGLWDSPRRVVSVGPYRWVRNPIYVAALLIVGGEAWLFQSAGVLFYALGLAVAFHLVVVGCEEPRLRRRFGTSYEDYQGLVSRWLPRRAR